MKTLPLVALTAVVACISEEKAGRVDTAPDTFADSADGLDHFDAADSVAPADSAPEVADTAIAETTPAEVVPGPCVNEGGPCDDLNQCTGAGTCHSGVCEPGRALACDDGGPCVHAYCDPARGCVNAPIAGGYCDALGPATWGTCSGPRMAPPDSCDVEGTCVDVTLGAAVPLPRDLVLGEWFHVSVNALNFAHTRTGKLTFETSGLLNGGLLTTDGLVLVDDSVGNRSWCIDQNLGIAFDIGSGVHFVGQVDPAGETMAAAGDPQNEMFVAVRPNGVIFDAHGTYAVLLSRLGADNAFAVWTGAVAFDHGCAVDGATLRSTSKNQLIYVDDAEACLTPTTHKVVNLALPITYENGTKAVWQVGGAIGAGGRVMLFTQPPSGALNAGYGMIVMVRMSDSKSHFTGGTRWTIGIQEFAGELLPNHRGAHGVLLFDDLALANGVYGPDAVYGKDIAFDDYGRFVMTLRSSTELRTLSGYLAEDGSVGFFYEVAPPAEWSDVLQVTETPAWPAFGMMVRRSGP